MKELSQAGYTSEEILFGGRRDRNPSPGARSPRYGRREFSPDGNVGYSASPRDYSPFSPSRMEGVQYEAAPYATLQRTIIDGSYPPQPGFNQVMTSTMRSTDSPVQTSAYIPTIRSDSPVQTTSYIQSPPVQTIRSPRTVYAAPAVASPATIRPGSPRSTYVDSPSDRFTFPVQSSPGIAIQPGVSSTLVAPARAGETKLQVIGLASMVFAVEVANGHKHRLHMEVTIGQEQNSVARIGLNSLDLQLPLKVDYPPGTAVRVSYAQVVEQTLSSEAPLECGECKTVVRAGYTFCTKCGKPVQPPAL